MESPFISSFKELVEVYSNKYIFAVVFLLSLFYTGLVYGIFVHFLNNYLSYFSLGALIIKTKGLQSFSTLVPYLLASPIVTILSFISPAILYVYFAFMAIKKKFGRTINRQELKERTKKGMFFFILFYFTLAFISSILSPLLVINSFAYAFIVFIIFYLSFFIPFALVIDDYNIIQSIKKGLILIQQKPLDPLLWSLVIAILLSALFVIIDISSRLLWPSGIILDRIVLNELLLFYINQMVIIPYGIILASYMYAVRYPMVRV